MKPSSKTCLLVLGMHRSGTSALTRVLNMLGGTLPKTLMQSVGGNETGHWESQKIVDFNDRFLKQHDSAWQDWREFDAEALTKKQHADFTKELGGLLASEYNDAPLIIVKDPRICRFAGLYADAITQAGYTVKCVHMVRNPLEVAASLEKRNEMPFIQANLLWLRHVLDAEYLSRNYDHSLLTYDGLLEHYAPCLERVSKEIKLSWPNTVGSIARAVEEFLSPNHKHHARSTQAVWLDPILRHWVAETYNIMHRTDTKPLGAKDKKSLDSIRQNFAEASPILYSIAENLADAKQANAQNLVKFEKEKAKKETLQGQKQDLSVWLKKVQGDVSDLTASLKQKNKDIIDMSGSLQKAVRAGDRVKRKFEKERTQKKSLIAVHKQKEEVHKQKEDDFHHALEDRHARVWDLELKLQSEIDHNTYKQAQIDAILNSSSWKIMALPRKMIRAWRHKMPLLISLLAGKQVRDQFKGSGDIGEMAKNARSKATIAARHELARSRGDSVGSGWLNAANGFVQCSDHDLPNITISAVTYNSEKWLKNFFASIIALDYPHGKISIHCVDNGSTDTTVEILQSYVEKYDAQFSSVKLFQRPNEGYGAGNDYGIRQSSDAFVLVTNVDTEFYPDSLRAIVNVAIHDDDKTACWEYRQTPYEHPKYYDPVTRLTNWSSHACILMRTKAYHAVGGYEKRIFMYGEDVELSYRFRAYGWNLRYVPNAVIKHYVDLDDHTLRPNQLSGSAAANILLRYRYGSYVDILAGEAFLRAVKRNETDPVRMSAWDEAARIIKTHRGHFFRKRKRNANAHFPFHEFDYDVIRPGAAVPHIPFKPDEKKDLPLISVVTRTHGKALHHLQNAVASVLGQTYGNIEHIIVEDRTEDARDYVQGLTAQYGDAIRYLHSVGDGRSACGNFGAQHAKGTYICWLDNDDLFFADHIETLVRALESNPDAVCSYALAWDALSKMDDETPIELSYQLPELHCRPYDKERLLTENFIPIQAIIFSKKLFDTYGGFNEEFSQLEDWNLWARYAQGGNFIYTPKVTSLYRTPQNEEQRQERHMALHAVYEDVRRKNLDDIAMINKKKQASETKRKKHATRSVSRAKS